MDSRTTGARRTTVAAALDDVVAYARERPGSVLAWVLGAHLLLWTLVPILVCPNLQLDLVEDLALGKEWQLGYWKHPPLPWWIADALYHVTGDVHSVYVLGPLCAVLTMYLVWRFAREVTDPVSALVAALALEGLHYFNFSVVKFAHDQMQLPFWALTGWLTWRALRHGRTSEWALAGAALALAFWSKYAAFALAAPIGLFLLLDPTARRAWRTPGPYVMAIAFFVVLAPHLQWLFESGFAPLHYVDSRAVTAGRWYQYLLFPLRWTGSQLLALLPALALLTIAVRANWWRIDDNEDAFTKRYVAALALGPFAVTTVIAALLGRLPIAMWGYPLWCFVPLAAVMWLAPSHEADRLRRFATVFALMFAGWIAIYAADELLEPMLRDRAKATNFPGRAVAEAITRAWRDKTGTPLVYVAQVERSSPGAGEFAANNVAVYSPDRPHVIVHGDPALSPWVDAVDLKGRGAAIVWEQAPGAPDLPEAVRARFPTAEVQPLLAIPRLVSRTGTTATVGYAFVLPKS
jgi:4-amino-4-deoxy-L-arabinose transferase-like glycosyltransferase